MEQWNFVHDSVNMPTRPESCPYLHARRVCGVVFDIRNSLLMCAHPCETDKLLEMLDAFVYVNMCSLCCAIFRGWNHQISW